MDDLNPPRASFPLFGSLPLELRDQIWSLLLTPQVITVNISWEASPLRSLDTKNISPQRAIPPLLHICHESRALALSYYEHGFQISKTEDVTRLVLEYQPKQFHEYIYWNPRYDTILLEFNQEYLTRPGYGLGYLFKDLSLDKRVRNLALEYNLWESGAWQIHWKSLVPGLEAIFLIWINYEWHLKEALGLQEDPWRGTQLKRVLLERQRLQRLPDFRDDLAFEIRFVDSSEHLLEPTNSILL